MTGELHSYERNLGLITYIFYRRIFAILHLSFSVSNRDHFAIHCNCSKQGRHTREISERHILAACGHLIVNSNDPHLLLNNMILPKQAYKQQKVVEMAEGTAAMINLDSAI